MSDNLPHMDYRQHRRARRLVHECCNYDEGNCLLLDDGEPCVCVQSISFSLMCHWFRVAVLPLDGEDVYKRQSLFPVYHGSAKNGLGIQPLMDAVTGLFQPIGEQGGACLLYTSRCV